MLLQNPSTVGKYAVAVIIDIAISIQQLGESRKNEARQVHRYTTLR